MKISISNDGRVPAGSAKNVRCHVNGWEISLYCSVVRSWHWKVFLSVWLAGLCANHRCLGCVLSTWWSFEAMTFIDVLLVIISTLFFLCRHQLVASRILVRKFCSNNFQLKWIFRLQGWWLIDRKFKWIGENSWDNWRFFNGTLLKVKQTFFHKFYCKSLKKFYF